MTSRRFAASLALVATGCGYTVVHGPPPAAEITSPETVSCTTGYGLPIVDGVAGGVVGFPVLRAIGLGLWDAGTKLNGNEPKDHDWWGVLLIPSLVGALAFAASGERGRRKVYACRRAKGMPLEGEDLVIKKGDDAQRAAEIACAASVPTGAPTDVFLTDPAQETVVLCPAEGAFAEGARGGSIVIRGDGTRRIGGLDGCSETAAGCRGEQADDLRRAIAAWIQADPNGGAEVSGKYYIYPPSCPTLDVERRLYISVTDWRSANVIARAAAVVVRQKRLSADDAVVIAVNRPCGP